MIADDTVVKFQLQAIDANEQPLTDTNIKIRILTPAKTPWFTSDFPIVEGTELLNLETVSPQGNLEFEQMLPIRGDYTIEVAVNPQVTGSFEDFKQSLTFSVPENTVKYRNLAILAVILLGVGFGSGWILGGDKTVREGEIAPQPVRMLLSGMTVVAIAVLLLVNWNAEVTASDVEVSAVPTSDAAVAKNQAIEIELLGDTQAVVGNLATKAVRVTNHNGKPLTDVRVGVESVALESDALIFAYQGTSDNIGKLIWQEQFFDGAPHRVTATVTPVENAPEQFEPLEVSQEIQVEGIAPPLFVRFISLFYFTLIFVVGLMAGLWGQKRKTAY